MAHSRVQDDMIYSSLGVRLPQDYLDFLTSHFKDLDDDPSDHCCWKSGFGNLSFVLGTTQAFRSQFEDFPKEFVIIGYIGPKKIIIDHQETELDVFVALNTETSEIFYVDTLGRIEKVSDSFDSWVKGFVSWISERAPQPRKLSLSWLRNIIKGKKSNDGR
ncbi:MAG: SMI1/KNR4 family protein [Thermodesulforhabdaceae bacterium]|jgi:hypothetical protein